MAVRRAHGASDGTITALTDRLPRARWRDRPGWSVAAASAPALFLVLVALWEMVAVSRESRRGPGDDEWRRLSSALRAVHRPGELILFAPDWIDPVGRRHLGDLIPLEMAGRMDAARYATIWEVADKGTRAPETDELEPVRSQDFGRLELRRYEQRPVTVLTDFAAALATAQVSGRGRPQASLEEVGFAPHRCVLVVPQPGETVRIQYPGVRVGSQLVGHVGLADVFTRRDVRDPARLVVSLDGRAIADVTVGVDDGWVRFAAPTPTRAGAVEFAITAVGPRARDRRVCFAAEARE
jgi:hypothetical protein